MTSQTLISDASVSSYSFQTNSSSSQASSKGEMVEAQSRLFEAMKSQYQVDQQVKFLHLQAEADSLLLQLKAIQQKRQTAVHSAQN